MRRHALERFVFQISMLIYSVVGGIVAFLVVLLTFGIGALIVRPARRGAADRGAGARHPGDDARQVGGEDYRYR